jgi:hypothetical protein
VPKRVFLSYPRTSRATVEALAHHLRRCGFDTYFDEQLSGGQPWWEELLDHIEVCDVFMPVLAADYIESVPCRSEAEFAEALGRPIIPVAVEPDIPLRMFPPRIVNTHCVSFDARDTGTWFDVVRALNNTPPAPPPPTPRPPRPPTPVTYLTDLADRVHFAGELTRQEQVLLLEDLKARYHGDADVRALTRRFADRTDLYQHVALQVAALLNQVPAGAPTAAVAGNGVHPPWAGAPAGPAAGHTRAGARPRRDPAPGPPWPGAYVPGGADGITVAPPPPAAKPPNHLLLVVGSILACGLMSPGWVALYFALQVDHRHAAGDLAGAAAASRNARIISIVTLVFAAFVVTLSLVFS